jgi:23S rRNA (pseudouridine1915-N3)-methyltransferase
MLKFDVIAVGRLRKGPLFELSQEYMKRIQWSLTVYEIEAKNGDARAVKAEENKKIAEYIKDGAFVIVMDERGNGLKSIDFAHTMRRLQDSGEKHIQFIIGGADGLSDETRGRANLLLSFGQQTWPHMLARVMILEQIYRAQQIIQGHPYHRE